MSSGDESNSNDPDETQFVDQPGDEDVLWAVQEITAERGRKYKVKWAGVDPATGKPWAQSWVAKHDCTNDLVIEWKKKKKITAARKRDRQTSTASRTSGASKRAGSSTSGTKTRRSTSSRLNTVERQVSPPPKQPATKRKRQLETISTDDVMQADEQGESSRPLKKQKTMLEVLLPPISSDEEEDEEALLALKTAKATMKDKVPVKSSRTSLDVADEGDGSPLKAKGKSERRSDARSKGSAPDVREESRPPHSKTRTKVIPQHKERVIDVSSAGSEGEEPQPPKSKKKLSSKQKSPSGQKDTLSERAESTITPIKVGPPRGVKRREKLQKSGACSKPGPSHIKSRQDDFADERVPIEEPKGYAEHEASVFGSPLLLRQNTGDNSASPSAHPSILHVPPSACPRSPDLSPGARARLELFDQMMAELSQPDEVPPPKPSWSDFNFDDDHDTHDVDTFDPPRPLRPSPSRSNQKHSKLRMPNGLIVPETESSGNSQSQSHMLLKPPSPLPQPPLVRNPSPRKPIDLPTITVIATSAASSFTSPQYLFSPSKLPPTNRPSKKPAFKVPPSIFRSGTNAHSLVADSEAPPSSIESFTSPGRVDKGKQRAVEEDQLQSSLSEREGDGERQKRQTQGKMTDSELKKRGKELFHQAQLAREAERRKNKKPKRLRAVNEIVNGTVTSPSKRSPFSLSGEAEGVLEMRLEDVVDLSGGANSTTLDTPGHSEKKPLTEEERERLRIELRQEEEESTQEAMGIYPPLPMKEPEATDDGDAQMPPPEPSKGANSRRHVEDADHVEQPSADLQLASVIVQASQEQQHEDMDNEHLQVNQPASSPPRPILENLTDSPRRRLGEALSLLNVKSEEIQRLERELADERKDLQTSKVELAELRLSSESIGAIRVAWEAERAQWTSERSKWESDFSAWETQRKEMSEERTKLSARVAELSDLAMQAEEVRLKLSELEVERVGWSKERDVMLNDMTQQSEELALLSKLRGEYDQDRLTWEVERTSWVEEKARWETERVALHEKQDNPLRSVDELTAAVESTRAAKISAENDRDFFREQYAQASGFVGSVREENIELEKRMKIAEGQAQEGVAAVKALFEGRVKALQADVDRWRGLTQLLQEKDRRTNDELRLRAAQAPELGELCDRLNTENKSLEADVRKLSQAQQRSVFQRNKLFYEILLLKKERASLRSKLSKLVKITDTSTQETSHSAPLPPTLEDPDSMDPNDMEIPLDPTPQSSYATLDEPALFPCMWRPQWRDQCQQIFDIKEDLERHLQEHYRDLSAQ